MITINIPATLVPRFSRKTWFTIGAVAALLVAVIAWYVYTTNAWTAEAVEDPAYREALIAQEKAVFADRDMDMYSDSVSYGECVLLQRSLFGVLTQRYYVMPYAHLNTREVPAAGQISWWTEMGVVCVDEKHEPCALPGGLSVTDCAVTFQTEGDKVEFNDYFMHGALHYVDGVQQKSVEILGGNLHRNVYTLERFPLRAPSVVDLSVGVDTMEVNREEHNLTTSASAVWQYQFASLFHQRVTGGEVKTSAEVVYNFWPES